MKNARGITLLDLVLWIAVLSITGGIIASFIKQPTLLIHQLNLANAQQAGLSAMDKVLNDVKEADSSSVPYAALMPNSMTPTLTTLPWFRKINFMKTPPFTYIQYEYKPDGTLVREESTTPPPVLVSTQTIVATQLASPDSTNPLFRQDPNAPNTLVLTLMYQPSSLLNGGPPVRLVYRISVRGGG